MGTPYTKSRAKWFDREHWTAPSHNSRRSIRYYQHLFRAWPDWCADDPEFRCIYKYAESLRECGYDVHVDHIVPIVNDIVCGLHVPWNLTVVFSGHNLSKSNHYWPDHPYENLDLFDDT